MKKGAFQRVNQRTPKSSKLFVSTSLDIVERIHAILEKQGKTQHELANALGKSPSEISKWMSGLHNFTIKSIAKIEAVLNEKILEVPGKHKIEFSINVQIIKIVEPRPSLIVKSKAFVPIDVSPYHFGSSKAKKYKKTTLNQFAVA